MQLISSGVIRSPRKRTVQPVDEATIQATLHHLPQTVADMVNLQRLTGMRREEFCAIRPCDVDTTADVWSFRPVSDGETL